MSTRTKTLFASALALIPALAYADDVEDVDCCMVGPHDRVCPPSDNDIVGYRECPRFGKWGRNLLDPYMFVDLGITARYFATVHPPLVLARGAGPVGGNTGVQKRNRALTFDERVGYGFAHGLYTAVDFELGNLDDFDTPQTTELSPVLGALVSIGARGGFEWLALSAEIAAGGMEYSSPTQDDASGQWLFEARGRAEMWVTPWLTVGGMLGASLIDRGDWLMGGYIGVHTWSFAGDR